MVCWDTKFLSETNCIYKKDEILYFSKEACDAVTRFMEIKL